MKGIIDKLVSIYGVVDVNDKKFRYSSPLDLDRRLIYDYYKISKSTQKFLIDYPGSLFMESDSLVAHLFIGYNFRSGTSIEQEVEKVVELQGFTDHLRSLGVQYIMFEPSRIGSYWPYNSVSRFYVAIKKVGWVFEDIILRSGSSKDSATRVYFKFRII